MGITSINIWLKSIKISELCINESVYLVSFKSMWNEICIFICLGTGTDQSGGDTGEGEGGGSQECRDSQGGGAGGAQGQTPEGEAGGDGPGEVWG